MNWKGELWQIFSLASFLSGESFFVIGNNRLNWTPFEKSSVENEMSTLQTLLEISSRSHNHLCPRQVLGVRIGLAGAAVLGLELQNCGKRLLAIIESDGCFADGIMAATGCTIGHRTLRVEDYGKIAATFVDVKTGRAVRVAPCIDARQRALACEPDEPRHYFAQLQAYQILPEAELFTFCEVQLATPVEQIVSRPGVRVECAVCGEEIINEREIQRDGQNLCRACAGQPYYQSSIAINSLSLARV
jgi:formylmethanofuran dehydrogenase subunit E